MKRAWILARKDLLLTQRDRLDMLFTFVMPLAFTVFFGLLFGGSGVSKFPLALVDRDGSGAASRELVAGLRASHVVTVKAMGGADAEKKVRDTKVAAALIVPDGFSQGLDAGRPVPLTVVLDPGSSGGQSVLEEVRATATRVGAERAAARAALQADGSAAGPDAPGWPKALEYARASLAKPTLAVSQRASGTASGTVPTGFVLSSPGMLINFILFSLLGAGITLILERKNGTLQRLRTTQLHGAEVIGGKVLGMVLLTLVQQVVLLGVAQVAFHVDYLRSPAALAMVMVSLSLLSACLGLMIATVFKTEQALVATTVLLSMGLAATGGGWFPLEVTGSGFAFVGHLLPIAWILDAFRGIILRGWGVTQVLPAVGIAMGYAVVLFAVGVWRFRYED